jgi:hypothetical protein
MSRFVLALLLSALLPVEAIAAGSLPALKRCGNKCAVTELKRCIAKYPLDKRVCQTDALMCISVCVHDHDPASRFKTEARWSRAIVKACKNVHDTDEDCDAAWGLDAVRALKGR